MDIKHLSTTLLQGWPVCPARSWEEYEARLEEGDSMEGADPTRFGSIVHEVAERVHQMQMRDEEVPDPIDLFDQIWAEHKCSDFEYYQLGRTSIEEFLDRTLYDREGSTIGVEVVFCLDVVNQKIWLHEQVTPKLVAQIIKRGGVPVVSKIDRIDRLEDGSLEIFDYKTNVLPFTRWEVENSVQLGTYDLAARLIYPEAETVRCVYDMLRYGRQVTTFDVAQREALRHYLIDTYRQIEKASEPEERINKYCRWCHRRGRCNAYQEALKGDIRPVLVEDMDDPAGLEELHDEYELLKNREKLIKARAEEIRDMFASKYSENGGQPIRIGEGLDKEVYFSPNPRYEYDMREVWAVLKRHDALTLLLDVANIGKTAMDRALKGRSMLKEDILPLLNKRHVNPTMRKRRATTEPVPEEEEGE